MKKAITLLLTVVLGVMLAMPAMAQGKKDNNQVGAQSVSLEMKEGWLGVTYLHDGFDGLAGISGKVWNIQPRLDLKGIVVSDFKTNEKWYAGAMLAWRAYDKPDGLKVDLSLGVKGFDISNGFDNIRFEGKHPVVFGIGLSFPLKS
jgi:hypothetical protein